MPNNPINYSEYTLVLATKKITEALTKSMSYPLGVSELVADTVSGVYRVWVKTDYLNQQK